MHMTTFLVIANISYIIPFYSLETITAMNQVIKKSEFDLNFSYRKWIQVLVTHYCMNHLINGANNCLNLNLFSKLLLWRFLSYLE